jgi:hypothetical protein
MFGSLFSDEIIIFIHNNLLNLLKQPFYALANIAFQLNSLNYRLHKKANPRLALVNLKILHRHYSEIGTCEENRTVITG